MSEAEKYEAPSWDYIYQLLIDLADAIKKSGFDPDVIVGISRGGWPPARVISDFLDNPNLASIKVEFYFGIRKTKEEPVITQPVSVSVKGKKVLIVDDVADTGKSLKLVHENFLEQGATEVKVVTLYCKPWSIFRPHFHGRDTDAWIIFPWERYETIKKIGKELREEGKPISEIVKELVSMGLEPLIVKRFIEEIFQEASKAS